MENAKLKAELASAIATICSFSPDIGYGLADDSEMDIILRNTAEKTAEALQLKDDYAKHMLLELKEKQMESDSYKKRIQELEQILSDQYMKGQKFSGNNIDASCSGNTDEHKSEISVHEDQQLPSESSEPMDEVSSTSNLLDGNLEPPPRLTRKGQEGVDENMTDSSMVETQREGDSMNKPLNDLHPVLGTNVMVEEKADGDLVFELKNALEENKQQLSETMSRLKSTIEEVARLGKDLEISRNFLNESQVRQILPCSLLLKFSCIH